MFFNFATILNMKKYISLFLLSLFVVGLCLAPSIQKTNTTLCSADELFHDVYDYEFAEDNIKISVDYTEKFVAHGKDINVNVTLEKNEENLKKFQKYVKKRVDSADVGFVFYPITEVDGKVETKDLPAANYKYTITLPKKLKNKDLAIIAFTDYRTTRRPIPVEVTKEGTITFSGSEGVYAYAVVYNGIYKDLILIGCIMLLVLLICVAVKIYAVRKDNPAVLEKKEEKAKKQSKDAHKANKKLAQALKRQKEKEKKERLNRK